ncbi:hypothetical protein AB0D08_16515 [Kitasatospora sp. NPDC048540]|uniref:hypothetical protein n=1 Tax=unclassified Kitasatospora TaxID=2633591 RepID=UPI00053B621F|nr:hypothetical protein [Kitasatospora sp. MBT63]
MRNTVKGALVAAAALSAAAGLALAPATATTTATWTASPGGAWTAKAASPKLTDTRTGTKLTCSSSSAAGVLSSGNGLPISTISSVSWASCTGPLGITFAVTPQNLPWGINALTYNSATGVTTGTVTGVKAHISGAGCTADFAGPTSTTPATLTGTYSNSTNTLTISGGDLHAYNVSGSCLGLLNNGDAATYNAAYVLSAPQAITSP